MAKKQQTITNLIKELFKIKDRTDNYITFKNEQIDTFFNNNLSTKINKSLSSCNNTTNKEILDAGMISIYRLMFDFFSHYYHKGYFYPFDKKNNESDLLLTKYKRFYLHTYNKTKEEFIYEDLENILSEELDKYVSKKLIPIFESETNKQHKYNINTLIIFYETTKDIINLLSNMEMLHIKILLKEKFILSTNYCITLDKVSEVFYKEIINNKDQINEWVNLYSINEIKNNKGKHSYTDPLTIEFLKENPYLVIDTIYFNNDFKERLISTFNNLDEDLDGLLINSDNFQALNFIHNKYKNRISAVITDPPYNTGNTSFAYIDKYQHSTWITMMKNRLDLCYRLLSDNTWCSINIDDNEIHNLIKLSESSNLWSTTTTIVVKMSHMSGMKMGNINKKIPKIKEYVVILSKGDKGTLNPIYEPSSWKDTFNRYTGWIDFNKSDNPEDWTRKTLKDALKEARIDNKNIKEYTNFCINNAHHIYRTAVNDSLSNYPKDNKFHKHITATGIEKIILNGEEVLLASKYLKIINGKLTPVIPKGDIWDDIGINNIHNEGGVQLQNGKKPLKLIKRILNLITNNNDLVIDPFAGSATTAHAVIELNKKEGHRKYICIQDGEEYFNSITKKRIKNAIYSSEWRLNKPTTRSGCSHFFKYITLESYEDTLNNLNIHNNDNQKEQHEDKNRCSVDMLYEITKTNSKYEIKQDFDNIKHPFEYTLKINTKKGLINTKVDLPETFNYIKGITVKKNNKTTYFNYEYVSDKLTLITSDKNINMLGKIKVIEGEDQNNQSVLVIWIDYIKDIFENKNILKDIINQVTTNKHDIVYLNGNNI